MKKLRVFFACVTSRLARLALRLLGRGGPERQRCAYIRG